MLEEINAEGGDYKKFLSEVRDGKSKTRLMGFGHRVYKNFDPRAKLLKNAADRLFSEMGINDQLLELAMRIEEEALQDEYFVKRRLYPNVDFYSGIIYARWAFPLTCSPSEDCPDGLPTGSNRRPKVRGFIALDSCTLAKRSAPSARIDAWFQPLNC